jgi:hypothetical protein
MATTISSATLMAPPASDRFNVGIDTPTASASLVTGPETAAKSGSYQPQACLRLSYSTDYVVLFSSFDNFCCGGVSVSPSPAGWSAAPG